MGYSPLKHKEYKICGQVDKDIFMEYLNLFKSLGGGYVKGNWQTPSFFYYPREKESEELQAQLRVIFNKSLDRI